jgi:hypothetical protein
MLGVSIVECLYGKRLYKRNMEFGGTRYVVGECGYILLHARLKG